MQAGTFAAAMLHCVNSARVDTSSIMDRAAASAPAYNKKISKYVQALQNDGSLTDEESNVQPIAFRIFDKAALTWWPFFCKNDSSVTTQDLQVLW